jgi:hypothetical protein
VLWPSPIGWKGLVNERCAASTACKTLDKQLENIDRDICDHIDRHFKQHREMLDSVKGVGPVTILTLISALPKLGRLGRREISKPVGVAPLAEDSGQRMGHRRLHAQAADHPQCHGQRPSRWNPQAHLQPKGVVDA